METINKLNVLLDGRHVGTMAMHQRNLTAFEYSEAWAENGFSISPFSLPLQAGVKISKATPFDGLFGIFEDSLPDGWGRLLVDRMLRKEGEVPGEITPMQRLSIVGDTGMGALEYVPVYETREKKEIGDLDRLADECAKVLASEDAAELDDIDELFSLGGSSGGARPKVLTMLDGEEWIIKFPSTGDPKDIGIMEYEYNECARRCGIDVPETRLFPSKKCEGYFGSKRFDRVKEQGNTLKIHMASASALLEVSHRVPALDYASLMALTWQLTKQSKELEKMYRLMCFNVYAHNRDDHSNNFSFLCNEGNWQLAPAYDLTYSNSIGGEHATTIDGEGRDPGINELLSVGKRANLKESEARNIAEEIQEIVQKDLSKYLSK